jgi:hypothetical protein
VLGFHRGAVDEERLVVVRGFWTVLGAGLVLAVTALSMRMNFEFGYSLGTSEGTGRIFGLLSVAFDGLKALLPLFVAWQWRDGRKLRAAAGAGLFVLVAAYGLASALIRLASREGVTASQVNLNASLKSTWSTSMRQNAPEGARRAPAERGGRGRHRAAEEGPLWDATSGCTDATLTASREFCKHVDSLRAELALAAEDNVLTAKIEGLKFKVRQLRERGAGRAVDPQLGEIARATGMDLLRVRSGMNWLLATAVEAVSCFGLFAIAWQRQAAGRRQKGGCQQAVAAGERGSDAARPLLRLPARGGSGGPERRRGRGKRTEGPGGPRRPARMAVRRKRMHDF